MKFIHKLLFILRMLLVLLFINDFAHSKMFVTLQIIHKKEAILADKIYVINKGFTPTHPVQT